MSTDRARRRASALAATRIHDFYEPLWEAGLALRNQGDIDTQQIAGAVATATHGSGTGYTSLSGAVRGMRLVTAAGEVLEIGEDDPDLLRAAQVSVGMLGVVTRVDLAVTEAYRLREHVGLRPWDDVREHWDELVSEHRHFGMFWLPSEESGALYNLRSHGDRMADQCYVKVYDAFLSPQYQTSTVVISVSGTPGTDYWAYLRSVDSLLADFDARVHWGKLHFLTPERLHELYPRADDFIALRRRLDPEGMFLNDHLRPLFA